MNTSKNLARRKERAQRICRTQKRTFVTLSGVIKTEVLHPTKGWKTM